MDDHELETNPFERDGPSDFERWLYQMNEAHAMYMVGLNKRLLALETAFKDLLDRQAAQSIAVMSMPRASKEDEKPS